MAEGVSTGGTILLKVSPIPAEAEAVAYVVGQGIGLDANTASSDYIQLYDGDKKTLMQSLERIQRTAAQILEAVMAGGEEHADTANGPARVAAA